MAHLLKYSMTKRPAKIKFLKNKYGLKTNQSRKT